VVQINVTAGLTRTLVTDPANPWLLVDAETVEVAVLTVIPSKQITLAEDPDRPGFHNLAWAPQQPTRGGAPITPNTAFGCGPANLSPAAFQPGLTLSLASQEDSVFHATQQLASAPKALWQNQTFTSHGVPRIDPKTGLVDTTIPDTLAGVALVPYLDRPDHTTPVPLSSLLYTLDDVQPFAWSPGVPPTSDPFTDQTVAGTIATPIVTAVRTTLLEALAGQGIAIDAVVSIAELANPGGDDLQAAPRLRLLGQQGRGVDAKDPS